MINRSIIKGVFIVSTYFITSCNLTNVLDQTPPHALATDHSIFDLPTAKNALVGAHAQLPDARIEYIGAYMAGLLKASSTGAGFVTNEVPTNNNSVALLWSNLYKVISASNGIIQTLPQLDESQIEDQKQKAEIIGSAKFLRAFAHFELLRYFGRFDDYESDRGIILRDALVDLSAYPKARSTVKECYDFILKDLEEAINEAPKVKRSSHASSYAAQALKARVYLYRAYARNKNVDDFIEAAKAADLMISNTTFKLEETFKDVFRLGFNSNELIFGRFPDKNTKVKYNNYVVSPSPFVAFSPKMDSLLKNDPRKDIIIGANPNYRTYKAIIKYSNNNQEADEALYLIKLSEMYLIKAEALALSGETVEKAKEPLNALLKRLGKESTANNHAELLEEIFNETVRELMLEDGHEWFAAIRFNKIEQLKGLKDKNKYILPIPLKEDDLNPLIDQNFGY